MKTTSKYIRKKEVLKNIFKYQFMRFIPFYILNGCKV